MTAKEQELAQLIGQLTSHHSELAAIEILPVAKSLYEELHPETRHGGDRADQVPNLRTWPSFAQYVADETGISLSTIYRRIETAEKLAPLDREARSRVVGTPLANQPRILARIAAIPKQELHRDVVNILLTAGPRKGKEELQRWEAEFGLTKSKAPRPEPEPAPNDPAEPKPTEETPVISGHLHDSSPASRPAQERATPDQSDRQRGEMYDQGVGVGKNLHVHPPVAGSNGPRLLR